MNGRDTVALLPTSGGKSVCFQIPALILEGICIVVSPLVALMTDQVNSLKKKGIKALELTGGISQEQVRITLENAMYGNYKFLYISPERLQQDLVQNCIRQMQVNIVAVDEAHCISQWGNDFRPAYKNINFLRELHPLAPFLALTATATPEVLKDTITELKLEMPQIFQSSFVRLNLSYQVVVENDKLTRIQSLLKNMQGRAIIYVRNRKMAVETSNHLNSMGLNSTFYHGGISTYEKTARLAGWHSGTFKVMVATNAFGMGIDQPNVRFVVHIQLPESLESYFQEAGRAGRDGEMANAIILYSDYDKQLVKNQYIDSLPTISLLKDLYKTLNKYFQIAYSEGEFTNHNFNFTQFCKTYGLNTLVTYNGLQSLDRLGIIQLSQEFGQRSLVQFIVPTDIVLEYFENNPRTALIGKTILRLYGGVFEGPTLINLEYISSKSGKKIETIIEELHKMERDKILELKLKTTDASITFIVPREDERTINKISKEVDKYNTSKVAQVTSVLKYIENGRECRSVQLVSYFGETDALPCGICSICVSKEIKNHNESISNISKRIMELLMNGAMNSGEISEMLDFKESSLLDTLRLMMDAGKLKINLKNQYYLVYGN